MNKTAIALLLAAFFMAGVAPAQFLEQDTMEAMLDGSANFRTRSGHSAYDVNLGLGYFVADSWEVGPSISIAADGADHGWGLGGFTEYNFILNFALIPFVGARAYFVSGDYYYESAIRFTGVLGFKFFISSNVALAASFFQHIATGDIFNDEAHKKNNDCGLNLGVRAFF